jgi:lipid-A-disaccharide synthase
MINQYKLFISVGEVSGDILAANLMRDLKKIPKYKFKFYGIAGERMISEGGIKSLFPSKELAIMGYLEIIPKIFKILFRLFQTILYIKKLMPDLIITVDSPGFNFLLVKLVKKFLNLDIAIIHYVAPTVWAYKPERAQKYAELFNHMLVIFPFEKKYFDKVGLKCSYVGNPTIESGNNYGQINKDDIRKEYGLIGKKIITIIPGSRKNELKYHLPVLREYMDELCKKYKNIFFILPTLGHLEKQIKRYLKHDNLIICKDDRDKNNLINISDLILCKSGTSVLESTAKKIPIIVFYKMNRFTAYIIKKKLKISYVAICNIVMNKSIIPELLQDNFNVRNLLLESEKFINNKEKVIQQLKDIELFLTKFDSSKIERQRASEVILSYLEGALASIKENK